MPERADRSRYEGRSWLALGVMTLACALMTAALFLVIEGAVAQ